MKWARSSFLPTLLAWAGLLLCSGFAGKADAVSSLDLFFELGLPDSRGAVWATFGGGGYSYGSSTLGLTGNCWWFRGPRGKGGRVILDQTSVHELVSEQGEEPVVADLEADIQELKSNLDQAAQRRTQHSEFDESSDDAGAGTALLFVAQLHRRKHPAAAELMPKIIALAKSPEAALGSAIVALANGKCQESLDRWLKGGSSLAYAEELERVIEQFPRGWTQRDAAVKLAKMLRQDASGNVPSASTDLARWIRQPGQDFGRFGCWAAMSGTAREVEHAPTVLKALIEDPASAVAQLVELGDDSVLCRVSAQSMGYQGSYELDSEAFAWRAIPRPATAKEVCRSVLSGAIPDQNQPIEEWAAEVKGLSKEAYVWHLIEASTQSSMILVNCVQYLSEHGTPASMARLQEVFCQSEVWDSYGTAIALESFLKKFSGDRDKLEKQILAALQFTRSQKQERIQTVTEAFHPKSIEETMRQISGMDEKKAMQELSKLYRKLRSAAPEEAEKALLVGAAELSNPKLKRGIIQMIPGVLNQKLSLIPKDPAAVAALRKLLADEETVTITTYEGSASMKIGETIAQQRVALCAPEKVPSNGPGSIERLRLGWMRQYVEAMISGSTAPEPLGSRKVPETRCWEIVTELGSLPAGEVVDKYRSYTPDEQIGVAQCLLGLNTWPESLIAARTCVKSTRPYTSGSAAPTPNWTGRKFDGNLRKEMEAYVHAEKQCGFFIVTAAVGEVLDGVQVEIRNTANFYSKVLAHRLEPSPGIETAMEDSSARVWMCGAVQGKSTFIDWDVEFDSPEKLQSWRKAYPKPANSRKALDGFFEAIDRVSKPDSRTAFTVEYAGFSSYQENENPETTDTDEPAMEEQTEYIEPDPDL